MRHQERYTDFILPLSGDGKRRAAISDAVKPIYEIPDDADYLYYFGSNLNHKLIVKSVRAKEHYHSALEHGRYYKSKDDVIQVIEMLTGKRYQE
ncbi:hypothetical protein [Aggregatibacter actinomycetemcomitans]|uniref:hypothetical protein n=1 Tax=Aggregatibacter actinomycetemcomitans TaxID=714 RepID=UPI001E509557|nr:hypothetical protein [Aggregatibacter actinomycetemcomitans]